MTKRDKQASEYAAESYAKSNGKRVNTTMNRDTTPAVGSVHGEGTVGERLVERLSITQTLLDDNETLRAENAQLRKAIRRLADQDATLSVQDSSVAVTLDATLTDAEHDALEFVVVMGRVANGWDKDILRQWLIRLRPEFDSAKAIKEGESDRSQPIGSPAKTNPTQPRNGTPAEGGVPGEGSVLGGER